MKRLLLLASLLSPALLLLPAADSVPAAPKVVVTPVGSFNVTASGQPIVLPHDKVRVLVSTYDIPSGANLPEHKHPFARYAYVLSGTLEVFNTETHQATTYKAGDFAIEAIGQWHKARNIGPDAVKLVVIDQVEGDQGNTIIRK